MPSGAPRRTAVVCGALFLATFALYGLSLARTPPYLSHDEVVFSLSAHAIATTARDVKGRLLPLFFEINSLFWATPIVVYTTALLLKIAPLDETVIRLPSAAIGALDVLLVYAVGLRIFATPRTALAAAALLALTPAHVIHSRMAAAFLLWIVYLERDDLRLLFAATSVLGIGCYSYVGAMIAMPLYAALLCALSIRHRPGAAPRVAAVAVAGLAWPLAALVPWLMAHPAQIAGQMRMYNVYDTAALTPLQGLRSLLAWSSITARVSVYYEFFNPAFLFFSGDASLMNSTRTAGVLLLPLIVLLPVGMVVLFTRHSTAARTATAAAVLLAPVAALAVLETKVNRELVMLPFAALAAAAGAEALLHARYRGWRWLAAALLAAVPLQFAYFYRDYLTDYRLRAAFWFEQNKRGAFENILARDLMRPVPTIYISRTPRWIDWYWKWYLAKAGRSDLLERTVYTVPQELDAAALAPHSVVFGEVEEVERSDLFRNAGRFVARIPEPNGTTSFIVFER